ncbi:hypothetical protein P43SY_007827 [Pythium insidiosum]|uniref:subtilisin n=1 Tax=Pythium insidiosum TaxID=114742 RepID=A0AAD5Q485_PYTIN|nr:hypothetical protein P43SY_007827 [Pythium insidiosum]
MMRPTDPQGNKPDYTKAPRVINNSWGKKGDRLDKLIAAWRAAGIIPVFAVGNKCPGCSSSTMYQAELQDVIAVGATDKEDGLYAGSCKGPSSTGLVKPDISAPGVSVKSVSTKSDSEYTAFSGTSMAAPHVTGTIALMLSAHPEYKYDQVLAKLRESAATKSLQPSGYECGGTPDTVFPNNQFGSGRVSAAKVMGLPASDEKPLETRDPCARLPLPYCVHATKCLWNKSKGRYGKCEPAPSANDNDSDRVIFG